MTEKNHYPAMTVYGVHVSAEQHQAIANEILELGGSFNHYYLAGVCNRHVQTKGSEHYRMADRIAQRLRERGLIVFEKGWWTVKSQGESHD